MYSHDIHYREKEQPREIEERQRRREQPDCQHPRNLKSEPVFLHTWDGTWWRYDLNGEYVQIPPYPEHRS